MISNKAYSGNRKYIILMKTGNLWLNIKNMLKNIMQKQLSLQVKINGIYQYPNRAPIKL